MGHRVYKNRVRVGLGIELVTLGLVLGIETGFGRGLGIRLGIGLVSYESIFIGKESWFNFELAHSLDSCQTSYLVPRYNTISDI